MIFSSFCTGMWNLSNVKGATFFLIRMFGVMYPVSDPQLLSHPSSDSPQLSLILLSPPHDTPAIGFN